MIQPSRQTIVVSGPHCLSHFEANASLGKRLLQLVARRCRTRSDTAHSALEKRRHACIIDGSLPPFRRCFTFGRQPNHAQLPHVPPSSGKAPRISLESSQIDEYLPPKRTVGPTCLRRASSPGPVCGLPTLVVAKTAVCSSYASGVWLTGVGRG